MVTKPNCDTCDDKGRVPWMIEGDPNCYQSPDADDMIPCPDCDHDVDDCPDDHEERWPSPLTRLRNSARARVRYARSLWEDRDSTAVAAMIAAHCNVLHDMPQLRAMIDRDLTRQINEVRTPLGWRKVDLRWSLTNAWRAVRGRDPLPLPYEVSTEVSMHEEGPGTEFWFAPRNLVTIRAERYRRPRATARRAAENRIEGLQR